MFSRIFIITVFLLLPGGCIFSEEPMPEVVHDYAVKIIKPQVSEPKRPVSNSDIDWNWLAFSSRYERRWKAIVIHHSGTREGNMAIFDKWHREGNHWEGVGYHFVIGNGVDSADGLVEVTYRWRNQRTGAHCGGTPRNWANREAIGICLVGNFDKVNPTGQQMRSLVRLIRFLQGRYKIPTNRIYGHKKTPGARITQCPGMRFPMARLKAVLNK